MKKLITNFAPSKLISNDQQTSERCIRFAGGVGNFQLPMNAVAIVTGGGERVGVENNMWYDEEKASPASSRDSVKRILVIEEAMGRKSFSIRETIGHIGV